MTICDGCLVRTPHEHRCFGMDALPLCQCTDPFCQERQGKEVDWDALLA